MLSAFIHHSTKENSPAECNADIKCIEYRMILHFESDAIYSAAFSALQSIWRNPMRALCMSFLQLQVLCRKATSTEHVRRTFVGDEILFRFIFFLMLLFFTILCRCSLSFFIQFIFLHALIVC